MPKVQETLTVTVDNAAYAVDKMSPALKQMIAFMDEWRQKEADVVVDLTMVRAALRDIQNQIYTTVNKEKQEALAKAQAMGLLPTAPEAVEPAANDTPAV